MTELQRMPQNGLKKNTDLFRGLRISAGVAENNNWGCGFQQLGLRKTTVDPADFNSWPCGFQQFHNIEYFKEQYKEQNKEYPKEAGGDFFDEDMRSEEKKMKMRSFDKAVDSKVHTRTPQAV